MRYFSILLLLFLINCKTSEQRKESHYYKRFTIDTSLNSRFAKAKSSSTLNLLTEYSGFWLLLNKKDFSKDFGNVDPKKFFDTLQTFSDVVCGCRIKNDTIYVQGGIAYDAGAGFDLKIVDNLFNGRIWVSGKEYWTKDSLNIQEEILLNSNSQSLKIQNPNSLKFGKKLFGELILESEDFFEKHSTVPNKFYLKLLFGCKVDSLIPF